MPRPATPVKLWLGVHSQGKGQNEVLGQSKRGLESICNKRWLTLDPTETAIQHWGHYSESTPCRKVLATSLALCRHIQVHSWQEKVGMEKRKQCLHWPAKLSWPHFPHTNRDSMLELNVSAEVRLFPLHPSLTQKYNPCGFPPSECCLMVQNFLPVSAPSQIQWVLRTMPQILHSLCHRWWWWQQQWHDHRVTVWVCIYNLCYVTHVCYTCMYMDLIALVQTHTSFFPSTFSVGQHQLWLTSCQNRRYTRLKLKQPMVPLDRRAVMWVYPTEDIRLQISHSTTWVSYWSHSPRKSFKSSSMTQKTSQCWFSDL